MKTYLVGGAVRDELLGRLVKERDWVVVGATETDMKRAGFKQVGKDFPVFLHPKTHEEYALARKERKTAPGYTGFEFDASPHVSLEEDLQRRDLTINAMAKTADGQLIDPYGGQNDLKNTLLRHVSPAFCEDPVRILRTARFAARFKFTVAPETMILMQEMVKQGEVNALVSERVWKELEKALQEPHPEAFFSVLESAHALPILFPHITGKHASFLKILHQSSDPLVRFAVLLHPLSEKDMMLFFERYRCPRHYQELSLLLLRHLKAYQQAKTSSNDALLSFFIQTDAFRRPQRFFDLLTCGEACSETSSSHYLESCYRMLQSIDIRPLIHPQNPQATADAIKAKRLESIAQWRKNLDINEGLL